MTETLSETSDLGCSLPFLIPSSVSGLISPLSIFLRICSASTWKIFSILVPFVNLWLRAKRELGVGVG